MEESIHSISANLYASYLKSPQEFYAFCSSVSGVFFRLNNHFPVEQVNEVSENVLELTGYSRQDYIGGNVQLQDVIEISDYKRVINSIKEVVSTERSIEIQFLIVNKCSDRRLLNARLIPWRNTNGEVIGIDGLLTDVTTQKDLELELERLIAVKSEFVDASSNIVFTKNLKGEYEFVNKVMADFFGVEKSDLIGKTDQELIPNDPRLPIYKKQDRFVFETGETYKTDAEFINSSWMNGWYKTVKSPIVSEGGKVSGLVAVVTDVSNLMESKETIREQSELLKTIYNTGNDFILVISPEDGEYYIESINQPCINLAKRHGHEIDLDDIRGLNMLDFAVASGVVDTKRLDTIKQNLDKVLRTKETYSYTSMVSVFGSKELHYFDLEITPILNQKKQVDYLVYRGRDFTEIMTYNKKLQEREELFESINRNVQDGIYRSTREDGFVYVNQSMSKLFGYSFLELQLMKPSDLYANKEDRAQLIEELQAVGYFSNREILFRKKSGTTFWGLLSCSMTIEASGKFVIDGIIVDITSNRAVQEKLRKSNESLRKINSELDHLVYRSSHDLRSPIASVLGLLELMKMDGLREENQEYVKMMEDQLFRLDKVILDIINIRKIAKSGLQHNQINFQELITDSLDSIKFLKQFDSIEKIISVGNNCEVVQDRNNLTIIINNLLTNAVKYANADRKNKYIKISCNTCSEWCIVEIEDNGIGIEEDLIDKVFDMFYRATEKNSGTGLGLFIVKEAVEKLNGSINVESVAGEWTRFTVKFPNLGLNK